MVYLKNYRKRDVIQISRKRIVNDIMREKVSHQVYDESCKETCRCYPNQSHKLFGSPGKHYFMNATETIKLYGGKKIADIIETILVKEYKRPIRTNIIGFQRENLNKKIEEIPDYYCLAIRSFGKLCSITIVTNSPVSDKYKRIKIDDDVFDIHFAVFDKKRLYNSLNTFNNKYNSNDVVHTEDVVELSYCISNVKNLFQKITLKNVLIFSLNKNLIMMIKNIFFMCLKNR